MAAATDSLNVLIVDDETEACENLKNILNEYVDSSINVTGIANNTREAERQMNLFSPDALFLDIEMPNENAFQFLDRLETINFEVVFVTAYDEYALRAFKLNAVDYILKPISIPELVGAVAKLKERIKLKKVITGNKLSFSELANTINTKAKINKLTLKDGNNIEVVDFKNIYFLEAQGSYSRILYYNENGEKDVTMSVSLADYEEMLPADIFYRIHKSYLINCRHVKNVIRDETNMVRLGTQYTLPISRRRFVPLLAFLKSNNYYAE